MHELEYATALSLRPKLKRDIWAAFWSVVGILALLGGFSLYCVFFWPTHPILSSTPKQVIFGVFAYAAMFAAFALLAIMSCRRRRWLASNAGLDIYIGIEPARRIPWNCIKEIEVLPGGIKVRHHAGRSKIDHMYWGSPTDGNRLREMWLRNLDLPQPIEGSPR